MSLDIVGFALNQFDVRFARYWPYQYLQGTVPKVAC
jgi:hypothetical protein